MFGANLKRYRRAKGFSQGELASKLYVTRQCVSKWEQGITQPDLETLTRISELLDVTVDLLLKERNDKGTEKRTTNFNKVFCIINLLVALFCALTFVSLCRCLPSTIPAHWSHGEIDRYGSSAEVLLHIVSIAVFLITDIILFFAFKKVLNNKIIIVAHAIILVFQIVYLIFMIVLYAKCIYGIFSFGTCVAASFILCIAIAMHPAIVKQNQWFGVRTSETLLNEVVWNKTNALACYLFSIVSSCILIANLIVVFDLACLCLISYVISIIVVIVYAKRIFAKTAKETKADDAD